MSERCDFYEAPDGRGWCRTHKRQETGCLREQLRIQGKSFEDGAAAWKKNAQELAKRAEDAEEKLAYYKDILDVAALNGCDEINYEAKKAVNCQDDPEVKEPDYCVPCRAAVATKE